jgi:hypothetical protein
LSEPGFGGISGIHMIVENLLIHPANPSNPLNPAQVTVHLVPLGFNPEKSVILIFR